MKRLTLEEIERQALAVRAGSPRRLPASWWDPDVARNMANWQIRNAPRALVRRFRTRRSS